MKSASLLNNTLSVPLVRFSGGILQYINNGINAERIMATVNTIILPNIVRPGILSHVAKYLPTKSPTLKRRNTVTGVKYFSDQDEFFEPSDSTKTATEGNMLKVTVKVTKTVSAYIQHSFITWKKLGTWRCCVLSSSTLL